MFSKGSRYFRVEEHEITEPTGKVIHYKKARPIADSPTSLCMVVQQGERIDLLAQRAYRDPEQFWRICDANRVMWPPDLLADSGERISIPPVQD